MAEYSGFFNSAGGSPEYNDCDFARMVSLLAGSEGYVINYGDELEVTWAGGFPVTLGTGAAFLGLGSPGWFYINDSSMDLSLKVQGAGEARIDIIALRVNRMPEAGVLCVSAVIIEGVPDASAPPRPTLEDGIDVYDMPLAEVYITGGVTANYALTDLRKPAVRDEARIKFITDTTRTLKLSDNRKIIMADNASAISYTVPPESATPFPVGAELVVIQYGAGAVTLAEGSGVEIRSGDDYLATDTKYKGFTLVKIASDEWLALGTEA
jgi:hypothetical protein